MALESNFTGQANLAECALSTILLANSFRKYSYLPSRPFVVWKERRSVLFRAVHHPNWRSAIRAARDFNWTASRESEQAVECHVHESLRRFAWSLAVWL